MLQDADNPHQDRDRRIQLEARAEALRKELEEVRETIAWLERAQVVMSKVYDSGEGESA